MGRTKLSGIASSAKDIAAKLSEADAEMGGGNHQGSVHRGLAEDVRREIIDLRNRMFELGIFDPVLVRFDTATVAQATNGEIAQRLEEISQAFAEVPD